jgi:hypothetical protein
MLCVSVAALLLYLVRLFGDRVFFGLLPLGSVLIGRGVRRLKPPDHRFSPLVDLDPLEPLGENLWLPRATTPALGARAAVVTTSIQ